MRAAERRERNEEDAGKEREAGGDGRGRAAGDEERYERGGHDGGACEEGSAAGEKER